MTVRFRAKNSIFINLSRTINPGEILTEEHVSILGGVEKVSKRDSVEEIIDVEAVQSEEASVDISEDAVAVAAESKKPSKKSAFCYDPEDMEGMQLSELNALASHAYQEDCEHQGIQVSEESIPAFRTKKDAKKYLSRDF